MLDRATGELVDCDAERCPHAVDGINHAPFSAFGGWSGAVNAGSADEVKAAVYDFFSYMSQPEQANEDVTIGITGFNPYRTSQFESLDLWLKAGMSEAAAKDYLGAIADSLNSPNMVLDLRIPQNQRYEQIVLDTAIHRMLAGEIDRDQAMADIETGWNEITEELGARSSSRPTRRRSASARIEAPQIASRASLDGRRRLPARRGVGGGLPGSVGRARAACSTSTRRRCSSCRPCWSCSRCRSFRCWSRLYLSLSRFRFVRGGFELKFIGLLNYKKLLLGSEQFHFLGTFGQLSAAGWTVLGLVAAPLIALLVRYARGEASS